MKRKHFIAGTAAAVIIVAAAAFLFTRAVEAPRTVAVTTPRAVSREDPPSQPETAIEATSVARQYFALYSAGQYAAAWSLFAPSAQHTVPLATWTGVHDGCVSPGSGLAYNVSDATVTGNTATVTVAFAGAASGLASGSEAFTYAGGRWGYTPSPADLSLYQHGSVPADIAAAKAAGYCSGS
jgi:hypothetical protein